MMKTVMAGALVCALGVGLISPAAGAGVAVPTLSHHLPVLLQGAPRAQTEFSENWSGYAVLPAPGHKVTAVHTTLIVPGTTTETPGGAATWTGVGGFGSNDLIQAGVEEGDLSGPSYYAWYETLPDTETVLTSGCSHDPNCTVNPGDNVKVDIVHGKGQRWTISLNDIGHWTFAKSMNYASTFSSAEWILEAPTAVFFGLLATTTIMPLMANTEFIGNTYALDGHAPQKMAKGSPIQVNMLLLGALPEAQPSPLGAEGDRFNGCAFSSNCPAPQ